MKKKLLVILAILAMLVLTLAACGQNMAQTTNEPSEDEMVSSVQEQKEESQPEEAAMIATFLESNDFSEKTIVPFCTSASDTIENSLHIFGELCPDAVIADGLTANDTEEIAPWLQQLGYEVSVVFEGTPITITAGGQVFEAVLDGSETAAAFADMLPMTLSMQRVGGDREFYGGMDSALPYDSADAQTAFENGDIAFWLGGDGLCLLYNNQVDNPEISAGIIVFGKITTDLSGFFDMDDHLDVVIEIAR